MKKKLNKKTASSGSHRKLKHYNSSGYSLSQSDIDQVKELSHKINNEMEGESLEKIKQRIDQ